jgi:hypothetical protein
MLRFVLLPDTVDVARLLDMHVRAHACERWRTTTAHDRTATRMGCAG